MNHTFKYLFIVICFVIFLNGNECADLVLTLDNLIKLGYSEDDFNPLFVEELNDIKKNPDLKKKDKFYTRLRSGQWFALRQQVEYESSELGLKRVVGALPVNPFVGGIFTPSISEIELADNICEALMEMRSKGLADKIGLKIAKDGIIRQKFCEEAAALYFNGLRQRPMTVSQKQNEAEKLGIIEYLDSSIDFIPGSLKLPVRDLGARPKVGGRFSGLTNYQEAELIAKQTLIRNFVHIVKLLHLDTLRKDPLRLREYFPGTISQIRHALDSDNPEIVAARLLQLGPTSDVIEEFINNHRGRRDLLLMKVPKKQKGRFSIRTPNDDLSDLVSNADFSNISLKTLENLAYKHVALTPMIKSAVKQLFEFIEKERDDDNNLFVPNIVSIINLLPELVKAELKVFLELNSKKSTERINTIEKIKSMIKNLQPVVRTFNNFDEEEIKAQIKDTVGSQNELNYYSRTISRIILTMLERRKMKIKENDPDEIVLLSNEPSVSLKSLIDIFKTMNNKSLAAIVEHIEKVVPNFTNKNMHSEATPQQKQEILALIKIPASPEISKQLFSESILRSLLVEAIPNQGGLLDRFVKGFYILMGETGVRLQLYLRNGYDTQNLEGEIQRRRVFPEDNLRHNSVHWLEAITSLLDDTLFNYELATRRLLQYLKECKLGIKFGSSEQDLKKTVSEIDKGYLQKLLDNMDQIKLTERKINALFLGEKGNSLILPNRRHHLINYIFNKDGDSLYRILIERKHYQVLLNIVELLEEIQLPKKEEVEIEGPYWDRTKNEWVNADKLMKNEVEVKVEPQKVTDLPITREQEWERIALFSKWSEFVKGIPIEFIPHGYKFSFGLYSNFINFCQRGIREIAYRLIVRDKGTNTEPEGKYWEYLPRNKYSVVIKADNSKDREEKVLSFCNAVYISIYGEKGVPDEYKKELPRTWSKETDKYEKEQFITPQEKQKNKCLILDNVNEQWAFIAKEARKPGILMAPNLPTDSSLLGDVWRNLYIEKQLATSSVDKVEDKISILSIMCVEALNTLKLKKNYYGQELYKIVYDNEDSISTFCHDSARRWFKEWPSEVSEEILLMRKSTDSRGSRERLMKSFDRSYLKKKKVKSEEIRPGYSTTKKTISPIVLEDFGKTLKEKKKVLSTDIPAELDDKNNPIRNGKNRTHNLDNEATYSSTYENTPEDTKNSKIKNKISKEVLDIIGNIN
ncbi:hypothetical protein FG386_000030 [Cryptosporidium ryanae]|uniref:uncharacterized protein n=1 Tax=Cryptosporidium ryanae TaxID=515981 RepID=UPI00351A3713|nr:hypothetical protein FG386_000030 [Cryptosporidium ryanae]